MTHLMILLDTIQKEADTNLKNEVKKMKDMNLYLESSRFFQK